MGNTKLSLLTTNPKLPFWGVIATFAVAEYVLTYLNLKAGFIIYLFLFILLSTQAYLKNKGAEFYLYLSLTLVPLLRTLSLSLPLSATPLIYWYLITSIPLFIVGWLIVKAGGFKLNEIGLNLSNLPLQLAIALGGGIMGFIQYLLIKPAFFIHAGTVPELLIWIIVLLVCTGFLEEFIFRGIMYNAAEKVLGSKDALSYVGLIYAILHVSAKSFGFIIYVFVVALLFNKLFTWQRSLLGLSMAHGILNITLYLICPLVIGF